MTSSTLAMLLPLFAALPLAAAALTVVVRKRFLGSFLMIAVPALTTAGGLVLLWHHRMDPVVVHHVGGFVPGVAIPFVSDSFTALMLTITGLSTTAATVFLVLTEEDRYRFVPSLVLMLTAGVNGALLTGDLFNLFVFIEVMLMPSYALIAVTGSWTRLGVGRTFTLVNLVTSTILLVGVGLVYGAAGTVNIAALADRGTDDLAVSLALTLVLVALAVKAAVMPVHTWLPRTYPSTSAGIMALFSAVHTKVAIYAILRIYTITFEEGALWAPVLEVLVLASIVLGALGSWGEPRVRSVLSWQMISGVGHIMVGIVLFTPLALGAGVFYMVHHMIVMSALLLLAGAIEHTYGTGRLDRLSGLMRREPLTATLFAFGLLALVGLPPTSGLWAKVGVVFGAAGPETVAGWALVAAIVVASLISFMALQRLWTEVFWGPPMERYRPLGPRGRERQHRLPDEVRVSGRLLAPGGALVLLSMVLFVAAEPLSAAAGQIGADLLDYHRYVEAVLR